MSAARFVLAAAVVLVAILVTPAALTPGVNSADLILLLAPFVLVGIVARRRPKTPAGGTTPSPDVPHVDAPPAGPTPQ